MTFFGGRVEVHGHRGARGLAPENTVPGFLRALEIGVDAVELDVGMTGDGVVVLAHDQVVSPVVLSDTGPAATGDPLFPYVGRAFAELTLAQVRTLDAGTRHGEGPGDPFTATQRPAPGTRVATLDEACAVLGPAGVELAVELKTDPDWPDGRVERFAAAVAEVLFTHGLLRRSRLLAFDWRVLAAAARIAPEPGRVALVEPKTLRPGTRWLAGLPPDDPVGSALAVGATVFSPEHTLTTTTLVQEAHAVALPVAVWTVNDPSAMAHFAEIGADAIVTDYPDRLHAVLDTLALPRPTPAVLTT